MREVQVQGLVRHPTEGIGDSAVRLTLVGSSSPHPISLFAIRCEGRRKGDISNLTLALRCTGTFLGLSGQVRCQ